MLVTKSLTKDCLFLLNIFVRTDLTSRDIVQYRIKGLWYFDKRQGELKYRLLGIAPVAPDVSVLGTDDAQSNPSRLFWVWYPAARNILHKAGYSTS